MEKLTGKERLEKSIERKRKLSRERSKRHYENKKREKEDEKALGTSVLTDVRNAISTVKEKRSDDARTAISVGLSLICGEEVAKNGLQNQLSKTLGINRRRIQASLQHRREVLNTATPWTLIRRKTRNDATPEETRKKAYEFWQKAGVSRPTGNKRDVSRQRVGPKDYIEHEKYILEKTQTEVYHEFKKEYPDIGIGQRY